MKPTYILFYKTQKCLTTLIHNIGQFRIQPISENSDIIEWEHYQLYLKQCKDSNEIAQGHGIRVWGIFIEKDLYGEMQMMNPDLLNTVLIPMTNAFEDLGCGIKII